MNKEQTFVSCGIDGTICIWDIVPNIEQSSDNYFKEILINIDELAEKNQNLNHLESRIHEMVAEHAFEIKRLESSYTEKLRQLEESNSCIVKNLKKRIKVGFVRREKMYAYLDYVYLLSSKFNYRKFPDRLWRKNILWN